MEQKNQWIKVLFVIVSIGALIIGVYGKVKALGYSKVEGTFSYAQHVNKVDSDGNRDSYYIYHYNYSVNGQDYEVKSDPKYEKKPVSTSLVVLYDPEHPEKSILSNDYSNDYLIIAGILFIFTILFFRQNKNDNDNDITHKKRMSNEEKMGWYLIIFPVTMFIMLYMKADFKLRTFFTTDLLFTIIFSIFIALGVYILVITRKKPNEGITNGSNLVTSENNEINNRSNSSSYDELVNGYSDKVSDVLNSDNAQKIRQGAYVLRGAAQILFGIFWCVIIMLPELLSILIVLISSATGGGSYTYNGEEVTAMQFIFGSFSPGRLIFVAIGVIVIIHGVKQIKNKGRIENEKKY